MVESSKIYATVIVDYEFGGGEPELTFFNTLSEAAEEADQAYESIVDGGLSVSTGTTEIIKVL